MQTSDAESKKRRHDELLRYAVDDPAGLQSWMAELDRNAAKETAIRQAQADAQRQIRNAAHFGPDFEAKLVEDADDEIELFDTPESLNDVAHPRNDPAHPDHIGWHARREMLYALAVHEPGSLPPDEPLQRDPVTWSVFSDEASQAGTAGAGSFGAVTDLLRGVEPGAAPANAAQPIGRVEG